MRKVIKSYEVVYPKAISVKAGMSVVILKRETNPEWAGWLWCKAQDGQSGWISESYLTIDGQKATLSRDYDAKEVAVEKDEMVNVIKIENGWAWVQKVDKSEGWIPLENLDR